MAQAILFDAHALVIKGDLKELEHVLKSDIREVKYEVNLLKWMMGFVLAGILSLVLKAFFIF